MRIGASGLALLVFALLFAVPLRAEPAGVAQGPVAQRYDPYKSFRYLLIWNGRPVAGFETIAALGGSTQIPANDSGRTKYDSITLERGVTYDEDFAHWASKVSQLGHALGSEVSLANVRDDIYLEYFNEAGQLVVTYKLAECWISQYSALPALDANANAIAIEHIKIENEGFERDLPVVEP
jgi:phage tail-like protein